MTVVDFRSAKLAKVRKTIRSVHCEVMECFYQVKYLESQLPGGSSKPGYWPQLAKLVYDHVQCNSGPFDPKLMIREFSERGFCLASTKEVHALLLELADSNILSVDRRKKLFRHYPDLWEDPVGP